MRRKWCSLPDLRRERWGAGRAAWGAGADSSGSRIHARAKCGGPLPAIRVLMPTAAPEDPNTTGHKFPSGEKHTQLMWGAAAVTVGCCRTHNNLKRTVLLCNHSGHTSHDTRLLHRVTSHRPRLPRPSSQRLPCKLGTKFLSFDSTSTFPKFLKVPSGVRPYRVPPIVRQYCLIIGLVYCNPVPQP